MSYCCSMGSELQFSEARLPFCRQLAHRPRSFSPLMETKKEETEAAPMAAHGETSKTGGVAEATQGGEPSSSSAGNVMNSANTEGEKGAISASEGEDSSTSSSPPEDNPIRGTSKQRQIVRRMCRELYERPWNADELLWNLSQNRLTSMATARVGDQLRALGEQKREDIADALFNNAYSALMAVGTLSGGTHLQRAHDQLRADPLQAFEMWAACKVRWQDKLGVPQSPKLWPQGQPSLFLGGPTMGPCRRRPRSKRQPKTTEARFLQPGGTKQVSLQGEVQRSQSRRKSIGTPEVTQLR